MRIDAAWRVAVAAAALSLFPADDPAPPLAPKPVLRSLDGAARQVAKAGRRAEYDDLLAAMRELGYPEDDEKKLAAAVAKDLAKPSGPSAPVPVPGAATAIARAAADLAALLPAASDADRARLAALALRLDDSVDAAHEALGEERDPVSGAWTTEADRTLAARRGVIEDAIRRARRLEVPLETGPSEHPVLLTAHGPDASGKRGSFVKIGPVEIHSTYRPEKLQRIVREAMRGAALSSFLLYGKLDLPRPGKFTWILSESVVSARKEIVAARDKGLLDAEQAEEALKNKVHPIAYDRRFGILQSALESSASANLLCDFAMDHVPKGTPANLELSVVQEAIRAGHLNWVCQAYLGTRFPRYSWREDVEHALAESRNRYARKLTGAARARHESMLRLSEAGIAGCRAWMQYLASVGEDPPFADTLKEEVGMIEGDLLLKATSVIEYLQETDRLLAVLRKAPVVVAKGEEHKKRAIEIMTKALGGPLVDFEKGWRAWILGTGRQAGLAERLAPPKGALAASGSAAGGSSPAAEAARYLNQLRRKSTADLDAVGVEESLSAGASAHARYLAKHPDQAAAWPDAHEEYSDREGFSPEGAWAGAHSVIAPGVGSPAEAIDGWMGTFYHRLPLLEPGLLRVGFSLEGGIAVMDASSLVKPPDGTVLAGRDLAKAPLAGVCVVWPPEGMTGVPTRFVSELPNPVPGVDQATFGYPITVQFPWAPHDARVEMNVSLHDGTAEGQAIECHVSTPKDPSNPELSPDNAWCLIPKAPLKPGHAYAIVVELVLTDAKGERRERFQSRFRT